VPHIEPRPGGPITGPEHYAGAERLLMLASRHSKGVTYSGSHAAVRCVVPECPTLTPTHGIGSADGLQSLVADGL
jgi:hypothetical protein